MSACAIARDHRHSEGRWSDSDNFESLLIRCCVQDEAIEENSKPSRENYPSIDVEQKSLSMFSIVNLLNRVASSVVANFYELVKVL